jgi:hypothetical protein
MKLERARRRMFFWSQLRGIFINNSFSLMCHARRGRSILTKKVTTLHVVQANNLMIFFVKSSKCIDSQLFRRSC